MTNYGRHGLKDVAARAQVSIATASRALNAETADMVSSATLNRVLKAAHDLRYLPNSLAAALKVGRSGVIGVLLSEIRSGLASEVLDGLQQTLLEHSYWPLLGGTLSWLDGRQPAFEALLSRRVDGFIIAPAVIDDPIIAKVLESGIPAVTVYGASGTPHIPSIIVDDMFGMKLVAAHFAKLGHHHIGVIIGPSTVYSTVSRARAISVAGGKHGLSVSFVKTDGFDIKDAIPATHALLALKPRPTAIVAISDTLAIGFIKELERLKLRVPDDMSVVGFGDIPMVEYLTPALTTVKVPSIELGKAAGRCLLAKLGGEAVHDIILQPDIALRASTKKLQH